MANNCLFELHFTGSKRSLRLFYGAAKIGLLGRITAFNADDKTEAILQTAETFADYDEQVTGIFFGDCAWSLSSCADFDGSLLQQASEEYSAVIEAYGSEPLAGFQEHIRYVDGRKIVYESVDYQEFYFETQEELDEYCAETGMEFELPEGHDLVITLGGFANWKFNDRKEEEND